MPLISTTPTYDIAARTPLDRMDCDEKGYTKTLPERKEQDALDAQELGCDAAISVEFWPICRYLYSRSGLRGGRGVSPVMPPRGIRVTHLNECRSLLTATQNMARQYRLRQMLTL